MRKNPGTPTSASGRRTAVNVVSQAVEGLEPRCMLSATVSKTVKAAAHVQYRPSSDLTPTVGVRYHSVSAAVRRSGQAYTNYIESLKTGQNRPSAVGSANPVGLTAAQVRKAYGIDSVNFAGLTGDGSGQTIAIIDAFDHPGFVNSTDPNFVNSDLHKFDVAMGLPDPPSFTKVDEHGGTSYPTTSSDWATETALDVEWAHAMAPQANIVLVEAASAFNSDLIATAANYARSIPGVSVVSMSFGIPGGTNGESVYDQYFTTPAGHTGVTFVAATGDKGAVLPSNGGATGTATGAYPAESPNVIAVGGTSLTLNGSGNYSSETAWVGSGGGISNYEAKPVYQAGVTQSSTKRTIPDVSLLADPSTGVAVYDSFNNTSVGGWSTSTIGGTSLSAPLWAGLMAVVDQGRVANGQGTLDGATQSVSRLYQLPASSLHDITTGNNKFDGTNGYSASSGYDLVTGRGTPIANTLLPMLAGGSYSGRTFTDNNGDGALNGSDAVLSGVTVYNDANNNGQLDAGEVSTVSSATGTYTLDLVGGVAYTIREVVPNGYVASPASRTGTTAYGTFNGTAYDLGSTPATYTAPAGTNTYIVRLNSAGTTVQIFLNTAVTGTPTWQFPKATAGSIVLNGNTGDDTFILDLTNGDPLTTLGVSFNGGANVTGDTAKLIAAPGGTSAVFGDSYFTYGSTEVDMTGVEKYAFTGAAGVDSLEIAQGLPSGAMAFTGGGGNDAITVDDRAVFVPAADLNAGGTSVSLTAKGAATVTLPTSQHVAALNVQGSAVVSLTGTGHVLRMSSLSVNSAGGAKLDLGSNAMVLDYTSTSPLSTLAALLTAGYAAGAWTGAGIRSSSAAADSTKRHTLSYGDAASLYGLNGNQTATFMGETVTAKSLLVRYTIAGDANLDGVVDFSDFLAFQTGFGQTGTSTVGGDFNFDLQTTFSDFLILQSNFGTTA